VSVVGKKKLVDKKQTKSKQKAEGTMTEDDDDDEWGGFIC